MRVRTLLEPLGGAVHPARAAQEPIVPQNDAEVTDCAPRRRPSRVLLPRDPHGRAGGVALVAEHHLRTTAGRISRARRQVVESANSASRALSPTWPGLLPRHGLVNVTVLLGFTLAAYNLYRMRSFQAKHGIDNDGQVVARPGRSGPAAAPGLWTEVVEPQAVPSKAPRGVKGCKQ
jgi:hypothetical protein